MASVAGLRRVALVGRFGKRKMNYYCKTMDSEVGKLKLIATDKGVAAILWENDKPSRVRLGPLSENEKHPVLQKVEKQLNEYFAGKRSRFSLKLDAKGTDFQHQVWQALLTI